MTSIRIIHYSTAKCVKGYSYNKYNKVVFTCYFPERRGYSWDCKSAKWQKHVYVETFDVDKVLLLLSLTTNDKSADKMRVSNSLNHLLQIYMIPQTINYIFSLDPESRHGFCFILLQNQLSSLIFLLTLNKIYVKGGTWVRISCTRDHQKFE